MGEGGEEWRGGGGGEGGGGGGGGRGGGGGGGGGVFVFDDRVYMCPIVKSDWLLCAWWWLNCDSH